MLMSSPRGDLSPRTNAGRPARSDFAPVPQRSPRKGRGLGGGAPPGGKRDDGVQLSPRVGPGVPRRPRRPGQVPGLNVNADVANRDRGVVPPLWTMPHARAREAIAGQLHGSHGRGDHAIQSPSRPLNAGHFAAKPSPRTRRFFFDTPSPRSVGTSGTGRTGGVGGHAGGGSSTGSGNSPRHRERLSHASKTSKVSEVSRASRVSSSPPSQSTRDGKESASEDGKSGSVADSSISSFNDPRSPRPDAGAEPSPPRRRRPRRKGVAMGKATVRSNLKLDLRGIGSHHNSERGGARSHRSHRAAPLSARVSGRAGKSAFTPRRRGVPSLTDYASGGVLTPGRRDAARGDAGAPLGSTPRSGGSGTFPSPSPPSQGRPTPRRTPRTLPLATPSRDAGGHHDSGAAGIAQPQPNTVPRARANVRALRVLGNARNSPRGVMAMLAARNAGDRPQSQQGSRSVGGAHGGRVRRGNPVVARPPVPTPATNGVDGPASGRSGSNAESGGSGGTSARSARSKRAVHLAPLRLDFASTTVRPSPLSAQPRRGVMRPVGLGAIETPTAAGHALLPLRTGLTRTVRSPTDDRGDLLSHGKRPRGMVVRADSTDGEVLLSGRRGSTAKLTPLNAAWRSQGLGMTGSSIRSHSSASSHDASSLARSLQSPPHGGLVTSSGASSPSALASARSKQEQVLRAGTPKTGARTLRPLGGSNHAGSSRTDAEGDRQPDALSLAPL